MLKYECNTNFFFTAIQVRERCVRATPDFFKMDFTIVNT